MYKLHVPPTPYNDFRGNLVRTAEPYDVSNLSLPIKFPPSVIIQIFCWQIVIKHTMYNK